MAAARSEDARNESKELRPQSRVVDWNLIKDPLQSRWVFWTFINDKTKDWYSCFKVAEKFDNVKGFWSAFDRMIPASEIRLGCDYSLFKEGIEPLFDNEQNKHGGRWLLSVDKRQRSTDLDNLWLKTLLYVIGETSEEGSSIINGACVNIRNRGDKLAVWTSDAQSEEAIMKIGRELKQRLNLNPQTKLTYQAHMDVCKLSLKNTICRYTV